MEQIILKAATTATSTDQGTFTAVISTAAVDREKDVVSAAGMVRALQKWATTGKKLPLAWNHSTSPDQQIGWIDPASAKQVGSEVVASGWIDQTIDAGQHVWRLVKAGTLGFSFGYLIIKGSKRKGGGRNIDELDVFEVTATTTPMNNDTRILGYKAAATGAPLRILNAMIDQAQQYIDAADDPEDAAEMSDILDDLKELVSDVDDAADQAEDQAEDTGKALRGLADRMERLYREGEFPELGPPAPEPPASKLDPLEPPDTRRQRRKAARLERENNDQRIPNMPDPSPEYATLSITHEEMAGLAHGELKAVWSAAYMNNLPDSAFLYIESGGTRDSDGKTTPRSLRHFPVRDATGAVDMPHLRNALARIPQSNLPQSVQDACTAKAQRMMDAQKSVDVTDRSHRTRAVDPLRALADATALEYASDGESRRKPPAQKHMPKPRPEFALDELRRRTRDETLKALSGVNEP